jgi:DNA-directed RNA polymerase beta' subunit
VTTESARVELRYVSCFVRSANNCRAFAFGATEKVRPRPKIPTHICSCTFNNSWERRSLHVKFIENEESQEKKRGKLVTKLITLSPHTGSNNKMEANDQSCLNKIIFRLTMANSYVEALKKMTTTTTTLLLS